MVTLGEAQATERESLAVWLYVGTTSHQGSGWEEAKMEPWCPGWFGHGGQTLASGPVLASICQGSQTGVSVPRTDPVSSIPAVPATLPYLTQLSWPCWVYNPWGGTAHLMLGSWASVEYVYMTCSLTLSTDSVALRFGGMEMGPLKQSAVIKRT